jgi:predicted HTH transcriptional regulator
MYVKEKGEITSREYQKLCLVKKRRTTKDLKELEEKDLLERVGRTGRGTYYVLKRHQRGKGVVKELKRGAKGGTHDR